MTRRQTPTVGPRYDPDGDVEVQLKDFHPERWSKRETSKLVEAARKEIAALRQREVLVARSVRKMEEFKSLLREKGVIHG